jgi:hypothetical protein
MIFGFLFSNPILLFGILSVIGFRLGYTLYKLLRHRKNVRSSKNISNNYIFASSGYINHNNINGSSENINHNNIVSSSEYIPTDADFSSETSLEHVGDNHSVSDSVSTVDLGIDVSEVAVHQELLIQEEKFQEINNQYASEMTEFSITHAELREIIDSFPETELYANDINELIVTIMSYYHG